MENERKYKSERLDRTEAIIKASASPKAKIDDEFARLRETQFVFRGNRNKIATPGGAGMDVNNARMDTRLIELVSR
jgi:hypothetical protein